MNVRCWSFAALGAALLAVPALAQTDAAPPDESGSSTFRSAFADDIAGGFDGERVFAVANLFAPAVPRPVRPPTDNKLLHRLQAVCESFSTDDRVIAPFAVRGTWVVAPLARDEVRFDYSNVSPMEALGRGALVSIALAETPPDKIAALGSTMGVSALELSAKAQYALLRALRSPMEVVTSTGPYGVYAFGMTGEHPPKSVTVRDLGGVRVRAQLRSTGVAMAEERGNIAYQQGEDGTGTRLVLSPYGTSWIVPVDLPATTRVPNTFKPSDLDGASLTAPLGFHGPFPLPDFLQRLSKATGLALKASNQYDDLFVIAGSDAITQGEALDGLRLALTASWRRIGDGYLLTWDQRGLGALDASLGMVTRSLRQAAAQMASENRGELPEMFGATLPFADDDPMPWTDTQRRKMFVDIEYGPNHGPLPGTPIPARITYDEMTPAQQQAARDQEERGLSEETGQPLPRWDAEKATLNHSLRMRVSIQLPGIGWVDVPDGPTLDASVFRTYAWMRKLDAATPRAFLRTPTALTMPRGFPRVSAQSRALMVSALDTATLARILPLMKARGYTALFYPAFTDGYATFSTDAFPLLPAIAGRGGLGDAARLARDNGIAIAAVVESMAWRAAGDHGHWTDAAPGWLGRDVLGRTLTQAIGRQADGYGDTVTARGDVARLSPATGQRLKNLLADLATLPGVQGVAFDAWGLSTILSAPAVLPTGFDFALPDRIASLEKDGMDTIDLPSVHLLEPSDLYAVAYPASDSGGQYAPARTGDAPYRALLDELVQAAGKARPDWKLYATMRGQGFGPPRSAPSSQFVPLCLGRPFFGGPGASNFLANVRRGERLPDAEYRAGLNFATDAHLLVYDVRDADAGIVTLPPED